MLNNGVMGGTETIDEEAERVAQAMAATEYETEVLETVETYKVLADLLADLLGDLL